MDKLIAEKQSCIDLIQGARKEIADLKCQKIQKRSLSWESAEGTAKGKEDYVRGSVAELDKEIDYKEANIEYLYNRIKILDYRLEHIDNE